MLQSKIDEMARRLAHEKVSGYYDDKSLENTIRRWLKENYGWECLSSEMNSILRSLFDLVEQRAEDREKEIIENKLLE